MEAPVVKSYVVSIDETSSPRVAVVSVDLLGVNPSLLTSEVTEGDKFEQVFTLEHGTSLLSLTLPFRVQAEACTAKWQRKAGRLIFRAPELVAASTKLAEAQDIIHDSHQNELDDLALLKQMYGDEVVCAPTIKAIHPPQAQPTPAPVADLPLSGPVACADPAAPTATACSAEHIPHSDRSMPAPPHHETSTRADDEAPRPSRATKQAVPAQERSTPCPPSQSTPSPSDQKAGSAGVGGGMTLVAPEEGRAGQPPVQEAQALDCANLALMLSSASLKAGLHQASAKKAAKTERKKVAAMLSRIASSLEQKGYAVCDNYVPIDLIIQARKEIKVMEDHYTEGEIWVGKDADVGATITRQDVRGDKVLWMDAEALAATAFVKDGLQRKCCFHTLTMVLKSVDRLVTGELPKVTEQLKHVRERSDAMLAIYPGGGARFAKHIDNTADDGRRLTLLCYLNPNWKIHQGGALRLFPTQGPPVDVYPHAGRMAMFLSKTVAHEVMPTQSPRHSFTLWYYDALERAQAIAAARIAADGTGSAEAQAAARDLVRDILAGDVSADGAVQADEQGVQELQARVKKLPNAALSILASITGVPSAQAFRDTVEVMEVSDLVQLRAALSNMGLGHTPTV